MDQKVLAGIGNIYADEVLFRSRLHPERPASGLIAGGGRPAPRGDRRGPGRGDRGGGVELRRGLPDGPGPGRGFLAQNAMYGRGGQALPGVLGADPQDEDRRADRPADALLPDAARS